MDMDAYRELLRIRVAHNVFVTVGQCIVKISVSLFLLRLVAERSHVIFLWCMIAFLAGFTFFSAFTLGMFLQTHKEGRCTKNFIVRLKAHSISPLS